MSLSDTKVGNTSFSSSCSRRSPQFMLRHSQGGQRQPPARTHSSPRSRCARAAPLPVQQNCGHTVPCSHFQHSTAQQGGYGPASAREASSQSKSLTPRPVPLPSVQYRALVSVGPTGSSAAAARPPPQPPPHRNFTPNSLCSQKNETA